MNKHKYFLCFRPLLANKTKFSFDRGVTVKTCSYYCSFPFPDPFLRELLSYVQSVYPFQCPAGSMAETLFRSSPPTQSKNGYLA